ncbi:putative lipid II flippase FtsW [Candidatus Roizmanbacteria bacterium]|nr:MAG: putative lipid II flippase FtsW [Candidatus Roizmanbacteria bacterium]
MRKRHKRLRKVEKEGNGLTMTWVLLIIAVLLVFIGLIFVFEASSIRALNATGDSFHYLKLQLRWIFFGSIVLGFFSWYNYKNLYFLSIPAMIGVILLLIVVLIPGIGHTAGGARSWINLGFITVQPTEFTKFAIILYLASWFSKKEKSRFLPFVLLLGFLLLLIMLQPDMGTAIMVFSLGIAMYFLGGQDLRYLLALAPVAVIGFAGLIFAAPYRLKRLTAFLNPENDPLGVGFHINQILISVTEGGLFGRGFGASRQKYLFLPEAHTDSIFAIISEELGFVGSFLIITLYFVFLYKLYQLYNSVDDRFGKLLIGGIFTYFGLQIIINLGGMVNIMPLTGVTLPFVSYGGSSMLASCMLLGIAINVARQTKT